MENTLNISFQLLVIHFCLGCDISHRTCTKYSINTGDILHNNGTLAKIKPIGYRMCLDCCILNSVCLPVVYNKEELKCELKAAPYPSLQATPIELRDMDKVCPQDKHSQIKGKCLEVIQRIQLSSGKMTCMSTTADGVTICARMVATYCHLPQYTHVTLYSRRYYVPINDNMCNEANFGNIALGKEATLTSTFDEYSKANQAVDGVWPEADINHRCAQTSLDWAPQLFIDLKQEHYVDHIVLLSRGDVEASHDFALSKINIWVDSSYCGYYEGPAEPGTNATIVCDKCLTGKVVAVSAWDGIRSRYLSVCEVMIIGLKK